MTNKTKTIEQLQNQRSQLIGDHARLIEQAENTTFIVKRIRFQNDAEAVLKEIGRVTVEIQAARTAQ